MSSTTFDKGSKNTYAVILGGKVRIEKFGSAGFTQVVQGGKPGAIKCSIEVVTKQTQPTDAY